MESRPSRVLGLALALLAISATLLAGVLTVRALRSPHEGAVPLKPSIALRFDVDYVLAEDGSMQVVENVVYDFRSPRGLLTRHYGRGIPRDTLPVEISATRDGAPEAVAWTAEGFGGHRLEIGSPAL